MYIAFFADGRFKDSSGRFLTRKTWEWEFSARFGLRLGIVGSLLSPAILSLYCLDVLQFREARTGF